MTYESPLPPAPERIAPLEGWVDPLPRRLSPTSLTTFLTCPEMFRQTYLHGMRSRVDSSLVIGGAFGSAQEANYGQKIESHTDLSVSDVKVAAAEAFDQRVSDEGGEAEVEWKDKPGEKTPGAAKDLTVNLAGAYREIAAPNVQPVAVEQELTIEIEGLPPVHGYADVVTGARVIEEKTAARATTTPKRGWLLQSAVYSAAAGLPTDVHVAVKTKTPQVIVPQDAPDLGGLHADGLALQRVELALSAVTAGILGLMDRIGPDEPWQGSPSIAFAASACGYCAFRENGCAWWM